MQILEQTSVNRAVFHSFSFRYLFFSVFLSVSLALFVSVALCVSVSLSLFSLFFFSEKTKLLVVFLKHSTDILDVSIEKYSFYEKNSFDEKKKSMVSNTKKVNFHINLPRIPNEQINAAVNNVRCMFLYSSHKLIEVSTRKITVDYIAFKSLFTQITEHVL